MKMKRFIALGTAGIMVLGACMVVSAAPTSNSVSGNSISGNSVTSTPSSTVSSTPSSTAEEAAQAAINAAFAAEVSSAGVSAEVYTAAQEAGLSVAEYVSNSIIEVPGLKNVTPVGQGDKIIVDGKKTNQTFSLRKPAATYVTSAKSQAASLGGDVLNVVNVQGGIASGKTATVNFYMPGVKTGENIQVYLYVDKQWNSLSVSEVRDDHVVVDMTKTGVLAFIQVK